jgi:hypothetical protein
MRGVKYLMINTFVVLTCWGLFYIGSLLFFNLYSGDTRTATFCKFFIFLIILSLVFLPGITGHYIFGDDTTAWRWPNKEWAAHPGYGFAARAGRPLSRIHLSILSLIDNVSDANFVRFLTIILISIIAVSMDVWFRMICGVSRNISFLLSLTIVTLPPFQLYVHWMSTYCMALAILMSMFSAILLLKPKSDDPDRLEFRTIYSSKIDQEKSRYFRLLQKIEKKIPLTIILSLSLWICSLLTYQPSTTFFVALLAFWLSGVDSRHLDLKKWPWLHLAIFIIAAGAYLFAFKMLVPANATGVDLYSNELTSNYLIKIIWFLTDPVVKVLHLWHLSPSITIACGIFFIILMGIAFEYFDLVRPRLEDKQRSEFVRNFLWKYLSIFILTFLSSIVIIVIKNNFFAYRSSAPLIVFIFLIFWSSVRKIISHYINEQKSEFAVTITLIFICVAGILSAHTTFKKYCVDNNSMELRYIENEIAQKYNYNITHIHIISPVASTSLIDTGEFDITNCSGHNCPWLVQIAFTENQIHPKDLIVSSDTKKVFFQPPNMLVIDLNKIQSSSPYLGSTANP